MNRKSLAVVLFSLSLISIPFVSSFVGYPVRPAHAQEEDLIDDLSRPEKIPVDENIAKLRKAESKYLELVERKLQLLTPEELERETVKLQRELVELDTNRTLMQVEKQLERIIEENPNSNAAVRAKTMLEAGRRAASPREAGVRSRQPITTFESEPDMVAPTPRRSAPRFENGSRIPNPGEADREGLR